MKTEIDDSNKNNQMNSKQNEEEDHHQEELRRGPWTLEEDTLLIHHVACHGEGRWNLLAKIAGLKRTGKSCRLRWLNYLKPDIKRGNLSPQEQLLILELHSKWGNRWSKIAAQLPGRTDNEIKNYWRTRVQKQARQLNMECNSPSFIDAIRCFYMPRLVQKTEQNSSYNVTTLNSVASQSQLEHFKYETTSTSPKDTCSSNTSLSSVLEFQDHPAKTRTSSKPSSSSLVQDDNTTFSCNYDMDSVSMSASEITVPDCHVEASDWFGNDVAGDDMWDLDELWQFKK